MMEGAKNGDVLWQENCLPFFLFKICNNATISMVLPFRAGQAVSRYGCPVSGTLVRGHPSTPEKLFKEPIMISKILKARGNFKSLVNYATQENKDWEVMMSNGVRDYDPKKTIADFAAQAAMNGNIKKMAFHMAISHHPNDTSQIKGKEKQVLENYLARLKDVGFDLDTTQYVIYRHGDQQHVHYHCIANYVCNDLKRLPDSNIGLKAKRASMELTREMKLTPAIKEKQREELKQSMKLKIKRIHGHRL